MKVLLFASIIAVCAFNYADAGAAEIVAAARSQIGVMYSWGGGGYKGKSLGIEQGAHTIGFDCSGLAQYAVYHGTEKILARTAATQYLDPKCHHVPFGEHQAGDLVFYGSPIHHVAIISGPQTMIEAPQTNERVHETAIRANERVANVQRCA